MKMILVLGCSLFVSVVASRGALVNAWFNEFHYDNAGTDAGEFIEVAVPTSFLDLANLKVTLYNGSGGAIYGTERAVSTFAVGSIAGGHQLYSFAYPVDGLQNGPPDGFALSYLGVLISGQFLSYEGVFTGVGGPAAGITSVNVGVSQSSSTLVGSSLGLNGIGSTYADFHWTSFADDTARFGKR